MLLQMATFRPLKIFTYLFLAALGFVAVGGLSLAAARGASLVVVRELVLQWLLLLQSLGSGHMGFSSVALRLGCLAACGVFPDQGSNP